MSRDDWVAIIKKHTFKGYALSASDGYDGGKDMETRGFLIFDVEKIEDAISIAQDYGAEYGYTFINNKYNKRKYRRLESKANVEEEA